MNIRLYEPALRNEGFFHLIYDSLLECKKARLVDDPRPLPRIVTPREHTSAWADFDGHPVVFDMNDHVFFYDLPALDHCEIYFKANLNWDVTDKVLQQAGRPDLKKKILPIFFFSPDPAHDRRFRRLNWFRNFGRTRYDICHVVGVYMKGIKGGALSPFSEAASGAVEPAPYHFWIRYHIQQALKDAGIPGYYRLTSRGNTTIEDDRIVFSNLNAWTYSNRIMEGRLTMVNTLPHAVLPWKAAESLAMGRPLIVERAPLVEMPEPFGLKNNIHYLELLPSVGGFDTAAPLDKPASYRVLNPINPADFAARAHWLKQVLADHARIAAMTEAAWHYADHILTGPVVADFICDHVRSRIH